MIRIWHVIPVLTWVVSLSGGIGEAKIAGGGLRNYVIGAGIGFGVGLVLGRIVWVIGRSAMKKDQGKDPMQVSSGTVFKEVAISFAWVSFGGIVATIAAKRALGI